MFLELDATIGSSQIYKKNVSIYIDETIIKIGSQHFWLWICIEPAHSSVLVHTFQTREISGLKFIRSLGKKMEDI
ncbi:MAG TPA: hypothetical protein VFK40_03985 [Nitrososphaeraceae archaeon]|jgi:transposase-like protein|nr:hypothetical protein [Nitrososphaeraceae archaeon]